MKRIYRIVKSRPLFTKLIFLYSMLIIGVLMVSSLFFYSYYRSLLVERSTTYMFQILEQVQKNIEINLNQVNQLSSIILSDASLQDFLSDQDPEITWETREKEKAIQKLCVDVMVSRQDIESISIYNNHGYYVGTDITNIMQHQFDSFYATALEMGGRLVWVFQPDSNLSILAVRTIYNLRLQPVGLLVIKYRRASIDRIINSKLGETGGRFLVLDRNDMVISCNDSSMLDTLFRPEIADSRKLNNTNYGYTDIYGENSLITFSDSDYNSWRYVGTVPRRVLNIDAASLILYSSFMVLVLCIVGIAAAGIIARSVSKPIRQLTTAVQNVDIQDLHFAHYSGTDEFSFLFESFNEMLDKIRQLIADNYEHKLLQNEIEIKMLHMQISPHFLYNTLDAVCCLAVQNGDLQVNQVVKALADMMRYSISGGNSAMAVVADEIAHIENYCAIQKIRMNSKFEYYIDVEEEILQEKIPRVSLQPLVENCIHHGFSRLEQDKLLVEVTGYREEDKCIISIMDNGGGIECEKARRLKENMRNVEFGQTHGIALPNIHARIRKLFGEGYGVTFVPLNEDGGATFTISLPYQNKGGNQICSTL